MTKINPIFGSDFWRFKCKILTKFVVFMLLSANILASPNSPSPKFSSLDNTKKNNGINDISVSGRVTDEDGKALEGVSIKIKGGSGGTSTDASGNYSINAPENGTLVFSSIGFATTEIKVGGRKVINVSLSSTIKTIDDVVVIGYGTANKRDLTGSIVKISGKSIADKPNTNPIASLQGRVAGLSVVNSGTPGAAPDIRIRGTISIGSVGPLYVVDGIFNDNINYLNPNDIESIEILKDPSSLAIFGVRGASGVIAITTKKAKAGQVVINFNTSYGTKKLVDKIKFADASQFRELFEEEKVNINVVDPFDYSKWPANTDWINEVTRVGHFNNNNLSIASSTEKNRFNMGFGYITDEGLIKHEKLEKLLLSVSDEVKLHKNLKIGFNLNFSKENAPYNATNVLNDARKVAPIVPAGTRPTRAKNPYGLDSGTYNLYYALPDIQNSGVVNPLIQLENEWNKRKVVEYRTVASIFAELSFLKNFNFRNTFYTDISNVNARTYTPLYNAYNTNLNVPFLYSPTTGVNESDQTYRKFQGDHTLTYKKSFGLHNLTALGGVTWYEFTNYNRDASSKQSLTGSPIPDDKRFWYVNNGFQDGASMVSNSNQRERTTASSLFRALYNYDGKYFFNASFRTDGSSQISPANRSQNFWAIGGAWDMTKEKFMQNQHIFNLVKLRASVGLLGNQNTYGYDYPFYPGLRQGTVAIFGNNIYNAYSQEYLPNPNLKWETVKSKEIGVELIAFKNQLRLDVAYFNKLTKDLMTFIPGINGAANGLDNIGSVKNSGLEFSASYDKKITNDLSITISGNLTTLKNKVTELATEDFAIIRGASRTLVGSPIGSFYGYIVEGLYQSYADKLNSPVVTAGSFTYGPGDFKYKDVNGDGIISEKDRTVIGNPTPDFTYGGSINIKYKNFDAGADFGGVYGNEIYRNWGGTESPFQRVNYAAFKVNRWRGPGTSNWDPILGQDHRINYETSTYGIEDGSYFRLRNIQLGYNLNTKLISKAHIKNLRVFFNAQNVKTWKNNSGYSPEFGGIATEFGVDNANNALPRVTTFGLNVTF
jgi:TonB-linked SusC/RagA family outer membrane protein